MVLYLQADYGWSMEGSVLGLLLFNVLINDLEEEIKCTLTKFAAYTKLRCAVNVLRGRVVFQRDLDRLEEQANKELMQGKCKVLHVGQINPL